MDGARGVARVLTAGLLATMVACGRLPTPLALPGDASVAPEAPASANPDEGAGSHRRGYVGALVDFLAAIRAVLSPAQRQRLATMPLLAAALRFRGIGRNLGLSDEQRQALRALRPFVFDRRLRLAFRRFLASGDRRRLTTAIQTSIDRLPSATGVAPALEALTPDQRQMLAAAVVARTGTDGGE